MKTATIIKTFSLIAIASILGACGLSTPVDLPQQKVYTLNSVKPRMIHHPRTTKTLLVTTPVPNPGYASANMIYMDVPYNLKYYANHQWASPPAQMLLPAIANAMNNTGYFKAVMAVPYSGVTDLRLDTRLLVLSQDFIRPTSRESLALEATLTNNMTNKVIASKYFKVTMNAPGNNAYSGVLAANRAVSVLGRDLARFVVSHAR